VNQPNTFSAQSRSNLGVVALVPDNWRDIVTVRHQVLGRLAQHLPVVWMNPATSLANALWPKAGTRMSDLWERPREGLHVLTAGWRHPVVYRSAMLNRHFLRSRLLAAKSYLQRLGCHSFCLYLWRDNFESALGLVDFDFTCYHIDDEYSFSETDSAIGFAEERLIRSVDQVVVHSPALMQKKGGINPNTTWIPNGVDFQSFSVATAMPNDLRSIPRPIVGYAGVIKKQLDLTLLVNIAKAKPNYSFVLVGPVLNVSGKEQLLAELQGMSNVHILGARPAEALPAYVQHFDVCLMCYEVNAYTKYIYPLKLHEYLAAGRPVVSSAIDTVLVTQPPVMVATTLDEWLVAIDNSLKPQAVARDAVNARQDLARQHDWNLLVKVIAKLFQDGVGRKQVK
jgi:glycosyltransferase involved in cell wall biosynthesis